MYTGNAETASWMSRVVLICAGSVATIAASVVAGMMAIDRSGYVLIVGAVTGNQILLGAAVFLGLAVVILLLMAAGASARTPRAAGLVRSGVLYSLAALTVVAGVPAALWIGMWNIPPELIRMPSTDGREVVVSVTSFTSVTYRVYVGSGLLFEQVSNGVLPTSHPPGLGADDFALSSADGKLVLFFAEAPGGPRSQSRELQP